MSAQFSATAAGGIRMGQRPVWNRHRPLGDEPRRFADYLIETAGNKHLLSLVGFLSVSRSGYRKKKVKD